MELNITNNYRRYVLFILFIVFTLNFLDRQLLSILLEPIKLEFLLTDAQMGVLSGIAFALFFTLLGFPMARYADRGNRVTLIAVALFIWSLFTFATGFVTGFWGLFITRILVGVGEAGCSPPSISLISDYYSAERRGRALSFYSLGIPFGVFCGLIIGGFVAANYGWRTAFFVAGLPGILLAILVKMTIISPPRGHADGLAKAGTQPEVQIKQSPFFSSIGNIWRTKSFRYMSLAAGSTSMVAYGVGIFLPAFLLRTQHIDIAKIGAVLALLYLGGAGIGMYLGGALADRLSNRTGNIKYYLRVPIVATLLMIPFGIYLAVLKDLSMIFVAIFFTNLLGIMFWGPTAALSQRLTRLNERATGVAVLLFLTNFIGLGIGPVLVGVLSEVFKTMFLNAGMDPLIVDAEGLRYALITMFPLSLIGCFFYLLSSRHIKKDIERLVHRFKSF